ncbi:MAG TPA: ABC transporter ATP-binding protein [Longimicrobiales bacterium]|nr:ABC transporter ATP-binding protein [Longimicrobiales bacterium]
MLLRVERLRTTFLLDEGELRAVDDVSFEIAEAETVALVGESGCGKTIVALSILDLVPPPGRVVGGRVVFRGEDLRDMDAEHLRRVRGAQIGMVFQEPGAALNPVFPVGKQIAEVLELHRGLTKEEARREAVRALGDVGIPEPEQRARAYPFELSGGMRQRAVIAIATCTRPGLLIADEPTTALDVTVQAEILDLLADLQARYRMAVLLITHDLGVVADVAERMLVMYTGKLVETGPTDALFDDARHPYTRGLLAARPRLGMGKDEPLRGIPGSVPDLLQLPGGCTFNPRCPLADEECLDAFPPLERRDGARAVACYKAEAE